jgi:hypothetical protein
MKRFLMLVGFLLFLAVPAVAQYHYAFYYDITGGQDVEINVLNPMFTTTNFAITVHDAFGEEIWATADSLASAQSGYLRLGDEVPYSDLAWGIVTVDSSDRLIIGIEYLLDYEVVSIDTVVTEVPALNPSETYWLGTYYSQVGDSETAFIVMNPWPEETTCTVTAYNSDAVTVYERTFTLAAHESEYVDLTSALGSGGLLWGLLDVTMQDRAVIVALEYYGRGCSGLEIDNVTEFYF